MPEHIKITMRTIFYATYFKTMLTCEETDLVLAFSIFYSPKSWLSKSIYHGHGLFLQFFGFFRSLEDLFTSAYYEGNQAVK